jgi:hypothetical protein
MPDTLPRVRSNANALTGVSGKDSQRRAAAASNVEPRVMTSSMSTTLAIRLLVGSTQKES